MKFVGGQNNDKQGLKKKTTLLSLILLTVCLCFTKQVRANLRFFFHKVYYIQCWQCFVLSKRTNVKRHEAFLWVTTHWSVIMLSTPSWDRRQTKPGCPLSTSFSWSRRWVWLYCLLQKAGWRVARPFVWPESAWWGWRSPRLVQSGLGPEEGEGRSAGHPSGTPGRVGGRKRVSAWELFLDIITCFVLNVKKQGEL